MSDEYNEIFICLADTVNHHFDKVSTVLGGHPHKLTLTKISIHGKNISFKV
jgi:hypothetical protein